MAPARGRGRRWEGRNKGRADAVYQSRPRLIALNSRSPPCGPPSSTAWLAATRPLPPPPSQPAPRGRQHGRRHAAGQEGGRDAGAQKHILSQPGSSPALTSGSSLAMTDDDSGWSPVMAPAYCCCSDGAHGCHLPMYIGVFRSLSLLLALVPWNFIFSCLLSLAFNL